MSTSGARDPGQFSDRPTPWIIAHRGASAYRPEHTLAAYQLALDQGADCLESDLVATKDGHLVVRHDNLLDLTTDVAERPEFARRRRQKEVDGKRLLGWFSEDFTLEEMLSLRARERIPELRAGSAENDDRDSVLSLEQVLAFLGEQEQLRHRQICFLPEIKHPHYFSALGLPMEAVLVDALHGAGYMRRSDPVHIQSFEVTALQKLRALTDLKLMQLLGRSGQPRDQQAIGSSLTYATMATEAGLAEIAGYADSIGPPKYFSHLSSQFLLRPSKDKVRSLVERAHAEGLEVYPYTFRAENHYLPVYWRKGVARATLGDLRAELLLFFDAGVDGVFIDNPDIGVSVKGQLESVASARSREGRLEAQPSEAANNTVPAGDDDHVLSSGAPSP